MNSIPGLKIILFAIVLYFVIKQAYHWALPATEYKRYDDEMRKISQSAASEEAEKLKKIVDELNAMNIEDQALRSCIEQYLTMVPAWVLSGRYKVPTDLEMMDCSRRDIHQLGGIEKFVNLKDLDLSGNPVNYINPLASLTSLERLNLARTQINSVWPITSLDKLQWLDLTGVKLDDLRHLLDFNSLRSLSYFIPNDVACRDVETFMQAARKASFDISPPQMCIDFNKESVRF